MGEESNYRIEIPILINDQTEGPARQIEERMGRMATKAKKETEMMKQHLMSLSKLQIEPIMQIKDQLTNSVLNADKLIKKLGMEKASPLIEAQDRVSAVVTRVDAALKALDRGDVKVIAGMQGPLMDEIVRAKASLKALEGVRAGPVAELRGELFGQLTRAFTEAKKLGQLMVEPRATLRERVTWKVREIGTGLRQLTSRAWTVTIEAKDKVAGVAKRIGGVLTSPLAAVGLIGGGIGLGALIKDFTMTAGRTETLNIAMKSVAKSTGTSMKGLLKQREAVMDLGIAEQEATMVMTRFMQGQIDIAEASKIARVAQDAAVIAGVNSSEATQTIVEAIAKLSPELLTAFGMTKNMNDIFADYADRIGIVVKTTDKYGKTVRHMTRDMTEAEKKQAMLNYVLEEGEKIAGTYEGAMGSAFKKMGSLTRYWTDFKTKVGAPLFLAAFGSVIDGLTDAFKSGIEWAEKNQKTLEQWGNKISGVFEGAIERVKSVIGSLIIDSPEFTQAGFTNKVQMLFEEAMGRAVGWLEGPGGQMISRAGTCVGRFFAAGLEMAIPFMVPVAVSLGSAVGKGILSGLWEAIKGSPWASLLLGGAGGATAGSVIPGVGTVVGAAVGAGGGLFMHYVGVQLDESKELAEKMGYAKHACGGILTQPHLGLVAEAGPEAIIPLSKPARAWELWQKVGDRMGFLDRGKVDYTIPTKIVQQRLALKTSGMGIDSPTSVLIQCMSGPLEKLRTETQCIIARGRESLTRIMSVVERMKSIIHVSSVAGPADLMPIVAVAATRYGIPAGLLSRLIQAESNWRSDAVSPAGAVGLTQVMPGTARGMGYPIEELHRSPALQIEAGAKYLAQQYNRFDSWPLALAAYNAGPGAVSKYGGIPPYSETQNYVAKILSPGSYATGGILTQPHLGLVAEAGPEAIIPLSTGMRSRALELWAETGKRLGVEARARKNVVSMAAYRNIKAYAAGGFAGAVQALPMASGWERDVPISSAPSMPATPATVNLSFDLAGLVGQVVIENQGDIDKAIGKITSELAEGLKKTFQNMTR